MKSRILFSLTIFMLLSIIALSACSRISEKSKETIRKYTPPNLGPNKTIIEASDDMEWIFGNNYQKWTPAAEDIDKAEKLITECFNDQKRATVNRLLNRKPEDYTKQFVGAINYKGEKIIWVNCFCTSQIDDFKDWKTKIVMVKDGGNCFFNLKINVDKNTYTDVIVNGNA